MAWSRTEHSCVFLCAHVYTPTPVCVSKRVNLYVRIRAQVHESASCVLVLRAHTHLACPCQHFCWTCGSPPHPGPALLLDMWPPHTPGGQLSLSTLRHYRGMMRASEPRKCWLGTSRIGGLGSKKHRSLSCTWMQLTGNMEA